MVLTKTTWSPDTCGCVIDYTSDTDNPDAPVTFLLAQNVCSFHVAQALADHGKLMASAVQTKSKQVTDLVGSMIEQDKQRNLGVIGHALQKTPQERRRRIQLHDEHGKKVGEYEEEEPATTPIEAQRLLNLLDDHYSSERRKYEMAVKRPFAFSLSTFNLVMEENQRKNTGYQDIINTVPAKLSKTGAKDGDLKDGIAFRYSYTGAAPNRVLNVSYTGITLTNADKNAIQTALNTKFGAGKVVIG